MIARPSSAPRESDSSCTVLLTPAEVAARFRVDPKTVTRWAQAGKIQSVLTLGGHHRFFADAIEQLLDESTKPRTAD